MQARAQVLKGGELDLHGAYFAPTWTRLAATVYPGNQRLYLQEAVNWQPGQLLFVTTSVWRDEWDNQNEVATIRAVEDGGFTLLLDEPMRYHHYGGPEYQSEVGLLSRSITLQGSPDTAVRNKRGGHVKIEGQGRIEVLRSSPASSSALSQQGHQYTETFSQPSSSLRAHIQALYLPAAAAGCCRCR